MILDLESLSKAIYTYKEILKKTENINFFSNLDDITKQALKAGVIQYFEFTYELSWKFIKRWLENNIGRAYTDGISRKNLFIMAAENKLIENVKHWMIYHRARNLTSHTYNKKIADEVYEVAKEFVIDAEKLLVRLEIKNTEEDIDHEFE